MRKYWKASEWRSFLLFYSPVLLKSVLPKKFFKHWCLLVFSIFYLMLMPISSQTLAHAELALVGLQRFVLRYVMLTCYVECFAILHVPDIQTLLWLTREKHDV